MIMQVSIQCSFTLQHSCSPNMFVQNVFIDTHDLRFPWVAFFAKRLVSKQSVCGGIIFLLSHPTGGSRHCRSSRGTTIMMRGLLKERISSVSVEPPTAEGVCSSVTYKQWFIFILCCVLISVTKQLFHQTKIISDQRTVTF